MSEFQQVEGIASRQPRSALAYADEHQNNDICRGSALKHSGIALNSDFIADDDVYGGTLVKLLPRVPTTNLEHLRGYPSPKHLPLRTRRMVESLGVAFGTLPWSEETGAGRS